MKIIKNQIKLKNNRIKIEFICNCIEIYNQLIENGFVSTRKLNDTEGSFLYINVITKVFIILGDKEQFERIVISFQKVNYSDLNNILIGNYIIE